MEFKIPFIVNSNSTAGARNRSSDGSSFEIFLDEALIVPPDAFNVFLIVQEAQVWNNVYNIQQGVNDKIRVVYDDGVLTTDNLLTIEPGLYDLAHLNQAVRRELANNGLDSNLLSLIADTASGKVVFQFNATGIQVDVSVPNNFSQVLGFDERLIPLAGPTTSEEEYVIGDRVAQFNNLEYFLIHSDLVSRGLRTNSIYNQSIAQIPITAPPGSLIVSEPRNPPQIPCNELIGTKRKLIRFFLTDDKNNLIDTNGEDWSARFVLHYTLPIVDAGVSQLTKMLEKAIVGGAMRVPRSTVSQVPQVPPWAS